MPVVRYLVDTSAWIRYPVPEVGARLDELMAAGVLVSCGVVELELLGAIADAATYAKVAGLRRASVEVRETTQADFRRALEVQAQLVERGYARVACPVLVVAATAERQGVTVLHGSRSFDVIAGTTGQAVEWVEPGRPG